MAPIELKKTNSLYFLDACAPGAFVLEKAFVGNAEIFKEFFETSWHFADHFHNYGSIGTLNKFLYVRKKIE